MKTSTKALEAGTQGRSFARTQNALFSAGRSISNGERCEAADVEAAAGRRGVAGRRSDLGAAGLQDANQIRDQERAGQRTQFSPQKTLDPDQFTQWGHPVMGLSDVHPH